MVSNNVCLSIQLFHMYTHAAYCYSSKSVEIMIRQRDEEVEERKITTTKNYSTFT
jgi:hypothetical protein